MVTTAADLDGAAEGSAGEGAGDGGHCWFGVLYRGEEEKKKGRVVRGVDDDLSGNPKLHV